MLLKYADSMRIQVCRVTYIIVHAVAAAMPCAVLLTERVVFISIHPSSPIQSNPIQSISIQVDAISLGQGQGPKAAALIAAAQKTGGW
jgi:hypothetical protein